MIFIFKLLAVKIQSFFTKHVSNYVSNFQRDKYMKHGKVNIAVVTDKRRKKNGDRLPLKLRITYKGERRYYSTGYDATDQQWNIVNSADAKGKLRDIRNNIAIIENDARKVCDDIKPFSFAEFEHEFFDQRIKYENLQSAFDAYVKELKENRQYGTAASYRTSCNVLHRFKSSLKFEDITKEFLQKFENWMIEDGYSITSVGIYIRTLRAIINLAKDNGMIKPELYPFGRRKYVIPTGKNVKRSLSKEEIKQLFNYETVEGTNMDKAKDFWIFSYLCNGINMMDIAKLKWKNVDNTTISFQRQKTIRTTRGNPINITAIRNAYINRILKKWGKEVVSKEHYIFDIISEEDSFELARKKIQQFTKVTNKWMKRMGEELGFDISLTTYVARHSFATILVRSGAPLAFASQSLGHTSVLTTQKYFAGFELAAQAEYTKALIDF
jgi:integrase/recombinase XerD